MLRNNSNCLGPLASTKELQEGCARHAQGKTPAAQDNCQPMLAKCKYVSHFKQADTIYF